jgi:hypothetical protein
MRTTSVLLLAGGLAAMTGSALAARAAGEDKALETLAAARKAIGDGKLESLRTFSVEATVQRNIGNMQMNSETEIFVSLPDKYLRSDVSSGGMMSMTSRTGFNGSTAIRPEGASMLPGGGMVIRMGAGGPMPQEKLTPEAEQEMNRMMLRSARSEISRLMLGWFATAHPAAAAEYAYVGEAESPDGKAHVIDAKNPDGFTARLFLDQQTGLPLMLTYEGPQPRIMTNRVPRPGGPAGRSGGGAHGVGQARAASDEESKKAREELDKEIKDLQAAPPALVEHTLYFEDWKRVDGVQFPHTVRRAIAGTTSEEWTIRKVRINPEIDPKRFDG